MTQKGSRLDRVLYPFGDRRIPLRSCAVCGKPYLPKGGSQKTCNDECSRKFNSRRRHKDRCEAYGLTKEDYDKLLASQENKCAICKKDKPDHIDHCHSTGKVQGVLCRLCNWMLGCAKDDPENLKRGAEYLISSG